MSFAVEIQIVFRYGLECYRAEVEVVRVGPGRPTNPTPSIFDTGAEVAMVSEDIARDLSLPAGGRPVSVVGSVSSGSGRLVPVAFRFAAEPGLTVATEWVVLPGNRRIAILGLRDVLPHVAVRAEDFDLYFIRKH